MITDYQTLLDQSADWAQRAEVAGWLSSESLQSLGQLDDKQLVSLFKEHGARPLIVAFFGGTGVGKSSLLNRMAGDIVAKVGVQRPTSMEVSLYLHEDFRETLNADELPTEDTRLAFHNQDERRLVAWLDLPDIDSTETRNQDVVQAWLPHIDWLVYVVSPERYHDDLGWRFLQSRGSKHAWVFVMNHWDQGQPEQLEDFRQKLLNADFKDPVVLRTSCGSAEIEDDFPQLEQTITNAIGQHGVDLLQSLGVQAQIDNRHLQLGEFRQDMGDDALWQAAHTRWNQDIDDALSTLKQQTQSSAQATTLALTAQSGSNPQFSPAQLAGSLWSNRANERLGDLASTLANSLQIQTLPFKPHQRLLEAGLEKLQQRASVNTEQALTDAMANPGTSFQRGMYRFAGILGWVLPLIASLWAVYHVIGTFYSGTQGEIAFLGINFAIHSGLLIGLSWLLPWLIQRKLKPSMIDAVKIGMSQGIEKSLGGIKESLSDIWQQGLQEKQATQTELESLREGLQQVKTDAHEQAAQFVSQG